MMGRGKSRISDETAGGPVRHIPVMLDEVLQALQPGPGSVIVDGTFGAGGYSRALISAGATVLGIDRDPDAIAAGAMLAKLSDGHLVLAHGRFGDLHRIAVDKGLSAADGVVLDIGVSSMQIDEAERGFSFMQDGPLDMRMEIAGPSAADVVNQARQADLTRIIGILGEEKRASQIAGAIARRREKEPFSRTLDLASLIESVLGRRPGERIHPATRTFQALRIFVNRELDELLHALEAAERLLKAGGRLVVVTFHSLEDRIVKRFFADRSQQPAGSRHLPPAESRMPTFALEKRGAIGASQAEVTANPRSRSAKLRAGVRTGAPPRESDPSLFGLPNLPPVERFSPGSTAP